MTRQVSWCALILVAVVGLPKVVVAQPQQPPPAAVVDALQQLRAEVAQLREAVKPRRFYLTKDGVRGSQALNACAVGFHMASLWEIFDITALKYDTTLGLTKPDSGEGPPSGQYGWIRTGGRASSVEGHPFNCKAWSDDTGGGMVVALPDSWFPTTATVPPDRQFIEAPIVPWTMGTGVCSTFPNVWCVQDR